MLQEFDRGAVCGGRGVQGKSTPRTTASASPSSFAQEGKTFMIELFVVVTPKKYRVGA